MHRFVGFLSILLSLSPLVCVNARAQNLLAGSQWIFTTPSHDDAAMTAIPNGVRITTNNPVNPFWGIMIRQSIPAAFPKGDRIKLLFTARSPEKCQIRALVERNEAPYVAPVSQILTLTDQWKQYVVMGVSTGFTSNELGAKFQAGFGKGVVELKDIRVEDAGPDPAYVSALAAIQPAAIQARIQKYRMGDLNVLVQDQNGKPVRDAEVKFEMTRHDFLFGCNFFLLDPSSNAPWQLEYRRKFAALFNYATLPFYWGAFEWTQGKPNYPKLDAMANWCIAHGITPKGHPLVWHQVYPSWAPNDPDKAIPLLHQRVTDIVTHYRGIIHYWDVVNEANSAAGDSNGEGDWVKRDGPAKVVATALGWARAAGKGADETFLYNDFNTGEQNVELLKTLQKMHSLPDAIGIQSHMHAGNWPLQQVYEVANRFSQFGIPVHFTETTILSGPFTRNEGGVTTPEGEKVQADYVVKFYTLLFSMPMLRAITWWDFSDRGAWMNAPAGLLRKDMSSKPVYDRLMQLIHHTWWTDAQERTNGKGEAGVHAFYGRYTITVSDGKGHQVSQKVDFPEECGEKTFTINLRK